MCRRESLIYETLRCQKIRHKSSIKQFLKKEFPKWNKLSSRIYDTGGSLKKIQKSNSIRQRGTSQLTKLSLIGS